MGKDQLQHKGDERQAGKGSDVDVDAEHDHDASRKASMADLRRQSVQMKPDTKTHDRKEEHDASNQQSYEAASASMQLLATRLHAGAAKLKEGLALEPGPANEQFLGSIDTHFERMQWAVEHTSSVLSAYDLDAARQSVLSHDIAKVIGAFDTWSPYMQQADQRAKANGFTKNRNINWVKQAVDTYAEKMGMKTTDFSRDTSAPEQDLDAATQSALHAHMEAAMAAVTSAKNDGSLDSIRARKHAQELLWLARTMPGKLHKKDKLFVKMKHAIREMEVTHPGMKSDLESTLHELDQVAK